jgi:hypothetical protein
MATASPAAGIREWEGTYPARPRHVRDARHAVEGFLSGCAAADETLLICSDSGHQLRLAQPVEG